MFQNKPRNNNEIDTSRKASASHFVSDIDPLHYHALQDTNNALKSEINRLSSFEQKCIILEEKVRLLGVYICVVDMLN